MPIELNPATPYLVPENTADTGQTSITASNAGTAGLTFNALSIGAAQRQSPNQHRAYHKSLERVVS